MTSKQRLKRGVTKCARLTLKLHNGVHRFHTSMRTKLAESSSEIVREEVRRRYGATARGESSACGDGCCTSTTANVLGYSAEQSAIAPEAANLGLGCGNPLAIASLQHGQTVLDLGSGSGFDCFLAARAVGPTG